MFAMCHASVQKKKLKNGRNPVTSTPTHAETLCVLDLSVLVGKRRVLEIDIKPLSQSTRESNWGLPLDWSLGGGACWLLGI